MTTCDSCFHWGRGDGTWAPCDNRDGVQVERRAEMLTRRDFSCAKYSAKLGFSVPPSPWREVKATPPLATQTDSVDQDKRSVGKRRITLIEPAAGNDWDQGGAVLPVKH